MEIETDPEVIVPLVAEVVNPPEDDSEVTVTIGDAAAPEEIDETKAPAWVGELRKTNRELIRRQRDLEAENKALKQSTAPALVIVGPEPSLEGCGFDAEKFKGEYKGWMERSQKAESRQREQQEQQQKTVVEWQGRFHGYVAAKQTLKVSDFQVAEDAVKAVFDEAQQSILIDIADKPELLVYALGKNPAKAKELAAIKNPVRFTAALAKLETQLKVTPRKPGVSPERVPQGGSAGASGAAAVDSQLEKLREEAAKTGDLSKVMAFKQQIKAKRAA